MVEGAQNPDPFGLRIFYLDCLFVRACIRHLAQERKFPVWYRYHYRRILSCEDGPCRPEDPETEYKDSDGGRGNWRNRARALGGSGSPCTYLFTWWRP